MTKKNWIIFLTISTLLVVIIGAKIGGVLAASPFLVISDQRFTRIDEAFREEQINQVLQQVNSPLAGYQETVGDQTLTAGDSIWIASQTLEYTINPKVLLVTQAINQANLQAPPSAFTKQTQELADNLWVWYSAYAAGERELMFADQSVMTVDDDLNPGSFALARYYAQMVKDQSELEQVLNYWKKTYKDMLNEDPASVDKDIKALPDIEPFMQLPFKQPNEGFVKVNSFLDHERPSVFDDWMLRFDGSEIGTASFNNCTVGIDCYGGHNGVDYKTGAGMPILAVAPGKVVYRYYNTDGSQGTVDSGLIIDHGNGYTTSYWHMDPIKVNNGDVISAGQEIGLSGNIGRSSGPHLHFGLKLAATGKSVDPYGWWSPDGRKDPWGDSVWMWKSDLTADNREAQAQLFFTTYWYRDSAGFEGESWWTTPVTSQSKSLNWGVWGTQIQTPGKYKVYAYWPKKAENTTEANYIVFHDGGSTVVPVNQQADGDRWVLLGSFNLSKGGKAVMMTDLNKKGGKRIYFDAVKWELETPSATPIPPTAAVQPTRIYVQPTAVPVRPTQGSTIPQVPIVYPTPLVSNPTARPTTNYVVPTVRVIYPTQVPPQPTAVPPQPTAIPPQPTATQVPTRVVVQPIQQPTQRPPVVVPGNPSAPVMLSPYGSVSGSHPYLRWSVVPGAAAYYYVVQNNAGVVERGWLSPADADCGSSSCAIQTRTALANDNYAVSVLANRGNNSPYSAPMTFTVRKTNPNAPDAPTLLSPRGSVNQSNPQFSWTPANGASSYFFFIFNGSRNVEGGWVTAAQANCQSGSCTRTLSKNLPVGTYAWWVLSKNNYGESGWSLGSVFKVESNSILLPGLTAPTLIEPLYRIGTNPPEFTWSKVPAATAYWLLVNDGQKNVQARWLALNELSCGINSCSYRLPASIPAGTYTWWVQPRTASSLGPWSPGAVVVYP